MIVVQNKGMIPDISNTSAKITSAINQTNPILIISPHNPKVSILIGKDIAFKIGLIKKLTNPKITPTAKSIK